MAKRFTDSRKWDDGWFLDISQQYKLLWIYVLDKCDQAGIYKISPKLEECCLGFSVNFDDAILKAFGNRFIRIGTDKIFIPGFIEFQYGVKSLESWTPRSNCEKSAMAKIEAINMKGSSTLKQPLTKGVGLVLGLGLGKDIPPPLESVTVYCKERNNNINPQEFIDHYQANGWMRGKTKIKDWKACIRTWESNEKKAVGWHEEGGRL
ncbi:MAG: hypothetical protein WC810_03140 [Janthinobacterium sp.]|jgi:hypothetical protein